MFYENLYDVPGLNPVMPQGAMYMMVGTGIHFFQFFPSGTCQHLTLTGQNKPFYMFIVGSKFWCMIGNSNFKVIASCKYIIFKIHDISTHKLSEVTHRNTRLKYEPESLLTMDSKIWVTIVIPSEVWSTWGNYWVLRVVCDILRNTVAYHDGNEVNCIVERNGPTANNWKNAWQQYWIFS